MHSGNAVLAERVDRRRADTVVDAHRGERPRIAADRAVLGRKAANVRRALRDRDHVGLGRADILGGDVAAAERIDRVPEGSEQLGRLLAAGAEQHDRLAAAHRQPGHRVLVAHPPAEAQRVAQGIVGVGIVPEAGAAGARTEVGGVQGDDGGHARPGVVRQFHELVFVEVRLGPECHRVPVQLYDFAK
jgi:hypothetical protein